LIEQFFRFRILAQMDGIQSQIGESLSDLDLVIGLARVVQAELMVFQSQLALFMMLIPDAQVAMHDGEQPFRGI
jgi:hypothetical protein